MFLRTTMRSPTPDTESSTSDDTPTRPGLPWQIVAAVTIFAALVATGVFVVLSDGDETASDASESTMELTPTEDIDTSDALEVTFRWPDGGEATLADTIDGPTVVNFFASWCAPCVREMPDFEEVSQEVGDDVTFLGLAVQDRPEDARRIVDRTGISYDWARDVRGDLAGAAGVVQMPTTMFLDADGTVVHLQAGAVDDERLRSLIEEHLGVDVEGSS